MENLKSARDRRAVGIDLTPAQKASLPNNSGLLRFGPNAADESLPFDATAGEPEALKSDATDRVEVIRSAQCSESAMPPLGDISQHPIEIPSSC